MILVTGGTGLVGSHLLLRLVETGESVRALYRKESTIQKTKSLFALYGKSALFAKIEWAEGNINNIPSLESAFQNIEYVYHCAALISFDPNDEELLRKTNIEGTANIVNFCLAFNIKKLCHVSSVAALGDLKPHETVINEETEWNPEKPHSDYAISKFGAEMEIWRGQQEGLNAVVVNPGIVLGPGFWEQSSGEIFSRVKRGLGFFTKGVTGFVAVNDVTAIMVALMKGDTSRERFVVVGENLSFEQVVKSIARSMNVKQPSNYATSGMTSIVSIFDAVASAITGRKRKLTRDSARSLHAVSHYSNEKIKSLLAYDFRDIEISIPEIVKLHQGTD